LSGVGFCTRRNPWPPFADLGLAREHEQQEEGQQREHRQGLELTRQEGGGALFDRPADLLHLGGAVVSGEDLLPEQPTHHQRDQRDDGHDHDERVVPS